MINPVVDVFIPTVSNHVPFIKRAFGSIYFQDYKPLRPILWVEDPFAPQINVMLNELWYEPHERKTNPPTGDAPVTVEYCSKGVLARNYQGRTGNAWRARQWIFEWEGKSDFVKMLDDDDILLPWAITVMMEYMKDGVDAVFHPLIGIPGKRISGIIKTGNEISLSGAGQMLLRKSTIDRILEGGFRWSRENDDSQFYKYFKSQNFNYVMTKETAMYLYIK